MSDKQDPELHWQVHGERSIYENHWVRLTLIDVEPPDGSRFEHHAVRLSRVALAVVLDSNDHVLMMWRHRFITDEWGWELPGGIIEDGEDGEETARREVEEETGWRPGPLRHLASFQPMPGMVDTPHSVYVGHGADQVGQPTDAEEAARVEWVPLDQIMDLVKAGQILGSGSLVGLLYLQADRNSRGEGKRVNPASLAD